MTIFPLSKERIASVIGAISDVHRAEAEAFGLSMEDTAGIFQWHIGEPFSGVFCHDDGRPFALVALESVGLLHWRIRFVATEEAIRSGGLGITRFLRDISDKIVSDTKGKIEVLSAPLTEKSRDWIHHMGFRMVKDDGNIGTFLKEG
ncbi:MAG: hypothetical protein WCV62_05705 [Candidatus Peribacteraceae bacterium]|jgi:hypothetical protein